MNTLKAFFTGLLAAAVLVGLMAQTDSVSISKIGDTYYADKYGVVCDGDTGKATTNTTQLNALNTLIMATSNKTGTIILPSGRCEFNGQWLIGTTTSGGANIGHVSVLGQGPHSTTMSWRGLNGGATGTPAIFVSRNKEFEFGKFALLNTVNLTGQYDTGTNLGIRFGGNAGGGTQTLGFITKQLGISNFDTCLQLGGNADGSAASDGIFDELTLQYCNTGYNSSGNFNSLDIHFRNLLGGFNKIGLLSSTGNVDVNTGSFSYNGIDFKSNGFGYFVVENMRSEGPGRFFYGAEPHVTLRNNTIAEVQGSRPLSGTVMCAPNSARSILVNFDKDPIGGLYEIAFSALALTQADAMKPVMIQLSNGEWFSGEYRTSPTSTTGRLLLASSSGTLIDESGAPVPLTIYDSPTCDLTFTSGIITKNDVAGNIMSPGGGVVSSNGGIARIWVDTVTSATTGTGYFTTSVGGNVPVLTTLPSTPSGALAGAGSGSVNNGAHQYFVTFLVNGIETKGSSAGSVTVTNSSTDGQVDLTSIPTGPTGTTARIVYRTAAAVTGVTNAKQLTVISDNVTTTYRDNASDASISSNFPGDDISRSRDTDPVFFDNIIVEWTTANYQMTIDNLNAHGIIKVRDGSNSGDLGSLRIANSKTFQAPVGRAQFPILTTQADNEWQITATAASIPDISGASSTGHTTGIQFGGSSVNQASLQVRSSFLLNALGNTSAIYAGIETALPDFIGRVVHGRFEPLFWAPRAIQGDGSTGDDYGNQYGAAIGIRPEVQLSRVASLGEFQHVNGKNLRTWCKFSASTTCAVSFVRNEDAKFENNSGDTVPRTREVRYLVTSGHFDVADLGKPFFVQVTSAAEYGTRNAYGWISQIQDATHIFVERSSGEIQLNGNEGAWAASRSATIGQNEPDANYMVFLSCDDNAVAYKAGSLATTGFTITASSSTSATCKALIVR